MKNTSLNIKLNGIKYDLIIDDNMMYPLEVAHTVLSYEKNLKDSFMVITSSFSIKKNETDKTVTVKFNN